MPFDFNKIESLYSQAGNLMWEPMLMWKPPSDKRDRIEDLCAQGAYFASIKKDGACYQGVKTQDYVYLFGRTISKKTGLLTEKIDNVPHIKQALETLPPNTVIVFEIYYPHKTSKDVTSIMGCLPQEAIKRQQNNPIHAYAHDILYYDDVDLRNAPALTRYQILSAIWEKHNLDQYDFMELAQPIYEDILETASAVIAEGEEGLVLRRKDGVWACEKRPAWTTIKIKQADATDLVCCGLCDATMEYTGKELETWPYWRVENEADGLISLTDVCQYENSLDPVYGKLYTPITKYYYNGDKSGIEIGAYDDDGNMVKLGTVSSGLTDNEKTQMAEHPEDYIGTVVALSCMSIDKKEHTLRHPVFKGWRYDKDAKDCKISEIFA